MLRKARFLITALALLATGATMATARDARVQEARLRRLKACVLLVPDMAIPDPEAEAPARSPNPNPYLFYVLNNRTDIKPDGWQIYNPAAAAYPSPAQIRRWGTLTGNPNALTAATPLRQDVGAYWEVALNEANFARLLQMDVIYLPAGPLNVAPAFMRFTERQRALLTRLADAGVTIWVDWAVNGATQLNYLGGSDNATNVRNPFFTNLDFIQAAGGAATPSVGHPLLAGQYVLQPGDSQRIGSPYNGSAAQTSLGRALNLHPAGMQPTANFAAVVPTNTAGLAYVAAARFGGGFVVGTAGNVGGALSTKGDGGNNAAPIQNIISPLAPAVTNEDIGLAETEDLKFAYNVFAWASEVSAQGKNGRHTGQSNVLVNGVLEQASYPNMVPAGGAGQPWLPYPLAGVAGAQLPVSPASPLLVNGTVIAATRYRNGSGVNVSELNVFEANPADDFDGNGYADDPIDANANPATNLFADLSIGLPYDRIMGVQVPGANSIITGMAIGELPESLANSTQQAKGYVFAVGSSGLFSLPVPRAGLPAADFWNNPNVPTQAPDAGVKYTGAPAFANLPGPSAGVVSSHLYAGGIANNVAFGSAGNGRIIGFDVASILGRGRVSKTSFAQQWAYPPQQESNRMGAVSGPVSVAQVQDLGTGAIDTMVFATSLFSGDISGGGGEGQGAGDTTGKVEGFIVATRGDVLGFPRGQNSPGGNNPNAGRRFVSTRLLDVQPGVGQVPQTAELIWDPNRYYEVRVLDKQTGYVLARYLPGTTGFTLLRDGTAGQVELPGPPTAWAVPNQPNMWDLTRIDLVADYSPLPIPVDTVAAPTIRPRFSPATPYFRGTDNTVQPTGIAGGVAVGKDNLIYYGTGIGYMCAAEWRKGRAQFRWKMRSREYNTAGGQSQVVDPDQAAYLGDYAFTAAPAAGDRIVFASRQGPGGAPGTVYVMEPDAVIRFKLPIAGSLSAARAQDVMLEGDHGLGLPQNDPFIASNTQPWGRLPGQFSVDPDTATVTFQNMENFSLDLNTAISPRDALANYGVDTGGRPAVLINWRFRNETIGTAHPPAVVPLPIVEVYRPDTNIVDHWISAPVLAGNKIFLAGQSGYLHELPADPKQINPNFPTATATGLEGFDLDSYGGGMRKVYNAGVVGVDGAVPSPAVGEGMIAVNTRRGLTMYASPSVVIADSGRIVEASGDSTALTSTDAVLKRRTDTSEFAIPTDPAFANTGGRPIITERKLLSQTAKVVKLNRISSLTAIFASGSPNLGNVDTPNSIREHSALADESYLVADAGNNRCIEFNPAGNAIWELKDFQDPYGLLPAGETLKLAGPMDVQRWVETETHPSLGALQVVHTLVADTGNSRVLEIVDKVLPQRGVFNANSYPVTPDQLAADGTTPIRWYHVVVWSSQTNAQGLRLKYRTAQRVFWPQANGDLIRIPSNSGSQAVSHFPGDPALPEEPYLSYTMASVGNQRVSYSDGNGVTSALNGYFRFFNLPTPLTQEGLSILERKPQVRSGGDSIVFLRGRWYMNETAPGNPIVAPIREEKRDPQGNVVTGDSYRLSQGVIDPAIPIVSDLYDELASGTPVSNNGVHRLNGVQSVQRTIRADVKFTPELYGRGSVRQMYAQYFLLADADGVWEYRMVPGPLGNAAPPGVPSPAGQARLAWAFTAEDYAYVTGAGNGNPAQLYSTNAANQTPGGRRFTPSSARRLPSGMVLITSRTPTNENPLTASTNAFRQLYAGGDVFLLRVTDYKTAAERLRDGTAGPYNRVNLVDGGGRPLHGWQAEQWVQNVFQANIPTFLRGAPSLRWRAAEALDSSVAPYRRSQLGVLGGSPYELTGSYLPVQPSYADLVY